jgi:hypothetical protein
VSNTPDRNWSTVIRFDEKTPSSSSCSKRSTLDAFGCGFDYFFRLSSSDRIVASGIWVLGLITAPAEPVQGSQARHPGELSAHDINDGDVPARSCGAKPLMRQQCRCALACGVIGKAVGGFWIIVDCPAGAFDVATG